ncbi:MAG TPA: GAF and ANTAR domain-containing protein [Acidimicrobiales bacterium]|jgi:transcriptional regulator with GAF, ATPase, and Fis domain
MADTRQSSNDFGASTSLSESLDRMAHMVLSDQNLDAVLQYLVGLAEAGVSAVDGVSVTLAATNQMETRHATSDDVFEADKAQYDSQQGPCLEATSTAQIVNTRIDDDHAKWPAFADKAKAAGFTEVLSVPLRMGGGAFGALNLYSRRESGFDAEGSADAQLFASQASVVLSNAAALAAAGLKHAQYEEALTTRDVIGQAKGILMARQACDADEAFDMLRRASQRANRKLRDIAQELVDATVGTGVPSGKD